jgi:hypothetical protein
MAVRDGDVVGRLYATLGSLDVDHAAGQVAEEVVVLNVATGETYQMDAVSPTVRLSS